MVKISDLRKPLKEWKMVLKKIIIIICCTVFLSACSPMFMAGSLTSSAINGDNRELGVMYDDQAIDAKILTIFAGDDKLQNTSDISSTTYNHKVLLVGTTTSYALKLHAANLVRPIHDVKYVYNYIRVKNPLPKSTYSEDTWLTTKVKSALLTQKGLKSAAIKIVTDNGVVYLLGIILPSQSKLAVNTTKKVDGVKNVVNLFEYLS
jgi:osmotically-inducible protein OsmY